MDEDYVKTFTDPVEEVCEFNSIQKGDDLNRVERLELFQLMTVNDLIFLSRFKALTELCINDQFGIVSLKGIGACTELKRLWVSNCELTDIDPELEMCKQLTELNLSSNRIQAMGPCSKLVNLEKLWLCGNKIRNIDNLCALKRLKEFWIARNFIEEVGRSLDGLNALEDLNLSDNKIGSFKELLNLAKISSLRRLFLSDPHFGSNPVCTLSNYQTFALCHLSVEILDAVKVDDQTRLVTEATFLKKRMYYNMRIKTLKRNTANVIRKGKEYKDSLISKMNLSLNVLVRQLKDVVREIEETEYLESKRNLSKSYIDKLLYKKAQLSNTIVARMGKIKTIQFKFDQFRYETEALSDEAAQQLILELETGGNIRFVEGKPNEPWYDTVLEFFKSHISWDDYRAKGVGDLKVTRILKVHNRFLRNRMDYRLATIKKSLDQDQDADVHKLFHFCDKQPLMEVIQDGYLRAEQYHSKLGTKHGAIQLSSHLTGQEIECRLKPSSQSRGRVVLTRASLPIYDECSKARQSIENGYTPTPMMKANASFSSLKSTIRKKKKYESIPLVNESFEEENKQVWCLSKAFDHHYKNRGDRSGSIFPRDYVNYHGVFQEVPRKSLSAEGEENFADWFVFDHALVIPEFVIEFEYVSFDKKFTESIRKLSARNVDEVAQTGGDQIQDICGEPLTLQESIDVGPMIKPLTRFLNEIKEMEISTAEEEECTSVLNLEPTIPVRTKLARLSTQTILNWCGESAAERIVYLNVHRNALQALDGIDSCINLKVLVASFNELQRIEGLDKNSQLERVELGFNLIKEISGFENLAKLEVLELNNNLLFKIEDAEVLERHNGKLRSIDLRHNALCEHRFYKSEFITRFPHLENLDGCIITTAERNEVKKKYKQLFLSPLVIFKHAWKPVFGNYESNGHQQEDNPLATLDEGWWKQVETVDIPRARIRKLENLSKLKNLRRASFPENEISCIEGFDRCTYLEELCLEGNRIFRIEGLGCCIFLKKLDLGRNKLTSIEGLSSLVNLTQLSLEDNQITRLDGLSTLSSLMELYLGNNQIGCIKEVQKLRMLPKLIIIDLLGNPLCADSSYRLYTVFYLEKLKVLDGAGVDAAEQASAKELYLGKVTPEFLEEKIGNQFYSQIHVLDLSSCRIRTIQPDSISPSAFSALKELNLDRNNVATLEGLPTLPSLQTLRLNYNRIASLEIGEQPNLENLHLGYNRIVDIRDLQLQKLPLLKTLNLQSNDINSMNGLETCRELRELCLDKNKFRSLEYMHDVFKFLVNLRTLKLDGNAIRTLGHLGSLIKLHSLYLQHNRISELNELEKLSVVPFLLELNAANNPVARKQTYRASIIHHLPTLKYIDGREITNEEKERAEVIFSPETLVSYSQSSTPIASIQNTTPYAEGSQQWTQNVATLTITGRIPAKVQPKSTLLTFPSSIDQPSRGGSGGKGGTGDRLGKTRHGSLEGPQIFASGAPISKSSNSALPRVGVSGAQNSWVKGSLGGKFHFTQESPNTTTQASQNSSIRPAKPRRNSSFSRHTPR